jgi:hypothetical protein
MYADADGHEMVQRCPIGDRTRPTLAAELLKVGQYETEFLLVVFQSTFDAPDIILEKLVAGQTALQAFRPIANSGTGQQPNYRGG